MHDVLCKRRTGVCSLSTYAAVSLDPAACQCAPRCWRWGLTICGCCLLVRKGLPLRLACTLAGRREPRQLCAWQLCADVDGSKDEAILQRLLVKRWPVQWTKSRASVSDVHLHLLSHSEIFIALSTSPQSEL